MGGITLDAPGPASGSLPVMRSAGDWFVLHVRSRQEKIVARCLAAMEIAHYLPLVASTRYYAGRPADLRVPLFPGYVFLRGSHDDAYRIDRTRRVAHVLEVQDQATLDWELANIQLALEKGLPLQPAKISRRSNRVRITAGPWQGLQGYESDRPDELVLQVEAIEKAYSAAVSHELLQAIS